MADKWLEALQKVHVPMPPAPAKRQLNVDPAFSDLVKMNDDDDVTALDPVGELIEKTRQDRTVNARRSPTIWRGLPDGELVIETDLAKIIGAREEDMAPLEK